MAKKENRYAQILERIFSKHYRKGMDTITFERDEFEEAANEMGIKLPKNLGDVVYSFRYRTNLPRSIADKAGEGHEWLILPAGRGRYRLVLSREANFVPNINLVKTKIPDATPGIISRYSFSDEQALLAKIRYNRLIDIFTGTTCYSLQNHLRTTVPGIGQIEIDELYVGIDKQGIHYIFPVQAKGGKDKIGAVQVQQDFAMCVKKFPNTIGRPIAAQFMDDSTIAMFEFFSTDEGIRVFAEKQYRLVHPDELSEQEIEEYRKRSMT